MLEVAFWGSANFGLLKKVAPVPCLPLRADWYVLALPDHKGAEVTIPNARYCRLLFIRIFLLSFSSLLL